MNTPLRSLILLLTVFLPSMETRGGTWIHFADFTTEHYWQSHDISIVTATNEDETNIFCRVDNQLTGSNPTNVVLGEKGPYFVSPFASNYSVPYNPHTGDRLIIFQARDQEHCAVDDYTCIELMRNNEDLQRLHALRAIQQLRSSATNASGLINALSRSDEDVIMYVLLRLRDDGHLATTPELEQKLVDLRDLISSEVYLRDLNSSGLRCLPGKVRLRAEQLLLKLQGAGPDSPAEYAWLQTAVQRLYCDYETPDSLSMYTLFTRLAEFGSRRQETVAFLSSIALDKSEPLGLRRKAVGFLSDEKLFHVSPPDNTSKDIFHLFEKLLLSSDPEDFGLKGDVGYAMDDIKQKTAKTGDPAGFAAAFDADLKTALSQEPDMKRRAPLEEIIWQATHGTERK